MVTQELKRKLTAILSADVEGYSRLMGDDEEATIRTLTTYRTAISNLVQRYRGRVVDSPGDNILAEFTSAVDAVNSAVEIQSELSARNTELRSDRRMAFRIGVNVGDVVEEGKRIYGDGVNIAARIESLSEAGAVYISRSAFDQVKNKLNLGYKYIGPQKVKNILDPVHIYKVLMDPADAGKVIGEKKVSLGISESLDTHYEAITKALFQGRVVFFIGEGANLCGRPASRKWASGRSDTLPTGAELAEHLAQNFDYPTNAPRDLVRVSQYVSLVSGPGPLYEELHSVFDADFEPTPLHRFIASVPSVLREKEYTSRYPLIVTTNYDDTLERAFRDIKEPFDFASYIAEGEHRGKFIHLSPEGDVRVIERPNEYRGLSLDQRSVILKIHGAVDRAAALWDSFLITEDHYIELRVRVRRNPHTTHG